MTTGKTMALMRGTLVGKVMSLLLNMVSRLKGGVAEKMRVKASSNLVSGNLDELLWCP